MRNARSILLLAALAITAACATVEVREPVTTVPLGNYVLVEPQPREYNAVAIGERAYAVRVGTQTFTGEHWVDDAGRLHLVDHSGACEGIESIWTYSYANDRITMNLVDDTCGMRPVAFPARMVYQRLR